MEASLVERWAADGSLPTFASLAERARAFTLDGRIDHLPDIAWPEIATGRLGASIGWFSVPRQLFSGESRPRPVRPDDVDLTAVWTHAAAAGRRVAAFDVPWAGPTSGDRAVHLWGWGTHDRPFGTGSDPPEALELLRRRHGEHALAHDHATRSHCDNHKDSHESYRDLLSRLLRGIELKTELALDLLAQEEWDLYFTVFSESHCVGHHFWHLLDPSSRWHDASAPRELKRAIRSVYTALDGALARLLARAGNGAMTVVFMPLGMGPMPGGWQLLPEVLVRLGYGSGHGKASAVRGRLPEPVKRVLRTAVHGQTRARLREAAGSLPFPLESSATRAVAVQNFPAGAIRLNLKGREPFGQVEPGEAYDAACYDLVAELLQLEDAGSGEKVVASALRADELYGERLHPNIPDILVSFRKDLGPIESARSPRVGKVSETFRTPALPRSGDHTGNGRLWVSGPNISSGSTRGEATTLDIAPTILRLLDVPQPASFDGRALEVL